MLREKMKLILSGKILKDTQTVAECAIKETDFLVRRRSTRACPTEERGCSTRFFLMLTNAQYLMVL